MTIKKELKEYLHTLQKWQEKCWGEVEMSIFTYYEEEEDILRLFAYVTDEDGDIQTHLNTMNTKEENDEEMSHISDYLKENHII